MPTALPNFSISEPEVLAFIVIPLLLVGALAWATHAASRRAGDTPARARRVMLLVTLAAAAWMAVTWTLASRGRFLDFSATPPPFAFLVIGGFVLSGSIAWRSLGGRLARHIPLWALVGIHGFRVPLEIAMNRLAERGIMPEQMSYSGRNFDVVTGITAIVVALLVWRGVGGRGLVLAWNLLGLALLANILTIAIASTPRFAAFGPDRLNVFVMVPPFVWLPAVMVVAALAGHLLVFRALLMKRPTRRASAVPVS